MIRFDQRGEPRLWAQDMMVGCLRMVRDGAMPGRTSRVGGCFFCKTIFSPQNMQGLNLSWTLDG